MSSLALMRHNLEYSRFIIAVSGMLTGLFAQAFRNLVRMVLFKLRICQIPVVLVGDGDVAKRVENNLANNSHIGFSIKLKFGENQLREVIPQAQKSDIKIMLACQDNRLFRAQMRDFATWFNYIEYLPQMEIFPVFGSHSVSVGHFGGLEMVNRTRMKALRWEKDILDWIATLIVLVLTSPLMVVIALLVKTTSSGPVFYKAKRLGKKGRPIEVYKFRSMYADADERLERLLRENTELAREFKSNFKLRNDPRVTPLGKFLRRTSLDELPQLLNVFKGEMSLVGPRPIVDQEVKYYAGNYEVFSSVKPGITGLWQTSGRSDSSYDERVGFDVYYVLNWSPWMDIWILIRTAFCVITMKGAY
jgi:undecaprenyl-phosphate galactose phosphotransferase